MDIKYVDINLFMPLIGILSLTMNLNASIYHSCTKKCGSIYTTLQNTNPPPPPPNGSQKLRVETVNPFSAANAFRFQIKHRLFRQTGRYSDRLLFRQVDSLTNRSLFRQVDSPTNRSLFRQVDSPTNRSIFRQVVIPTGR